MKTLLNLIHKPLRYTNNRTGTKSWPGQLQYRVFIENFMDNAEYLVRICCPTITEGANIPHEGPPLGMAGIHRSSTLGQRNTGSVPSWGWPGFTAQVHWRDGRPDRVIRWGWPGFTAQVH